MLAGRAMGGTGTAEESDPPQFWRTAPNSISCARPSSVLDRLSLQDKYFVYVHSGALWSYNPPYLLFADSLAAYTVIIQDR